MNKNIHHPPQAKELFIPARPPGHPASRGRPKGSLNAKPIVTRVAYQKHKIKENGKTKYLTTLELLITIIQREAIGGNHRAAAVRDRYLGNYLEPEIDSKQAHGVILAPRGMSAEEWIKNEEKKNAQSDQLMQEVMREMGLL